ncbi:hypothetical protein RFI_30995 [Reticulomyxa filosa]|uniref:Uncharacterized protein n=1 Tax=Reticulomyxa filosa TaxID=46433 RepID=X6LZ43_RETFI|nr:hypothetical protein RFI_30995 [Reticulomyxa filosa]|eukprot:ETO06402.1 hypothetical protein RFI_30995 [Reticulomyxa filosa]
MLLDVHYHVSKIEASSLIVASQKQKQRIVFGNASRTARRPPTADEQEKIIVVEIGASLWISAHYFCWTVSEIGYVLTDDLLYATQYLYSLYYSALAERRIRPRLMVPSLLGSPVQMSDMVVIGNARTNGYFARYHHVFLFFYLGKVPTMVFTEEIEEDVDVVAYDGRVNHGMEKLCETQAKTTNKQEEEEEKEKEKKEFQDSKEGGELYGVGFFLIKKPLLALLRLVVE